MRNHAATYDVLNPLRHTVLLLDHQQQRQGPFSALLHAARLALGARLPGAIQVSASQGEAVGPALLTIHPLFVIGLGAAGGAG